MKRMLRGANSAIEKRRLVEAVVLSSFGGLICIVLALAASVWIVSMLRVPFVFEQVSSLSLPILGTGRLIFGYLPALKRHSKTPGPDPSKHHATNNYRHLLSMFPRDLESRCSKILTANLR